MMVRKEDIKLIFFLSQKVKTIFSALTMVDKPEGHRILVMAPHPDDDILGCGGAIRLHRQSGHEVTIVYLTDGEKGIKNLNASKTSKLREEESKRAAEMLDVPGDHLFYLHLKDGDLINQSGTNYELRQLLEQVNPDVIYLPSFVEVHRDHYACNILLKNNLIKDVSIAAYEIWTPHIPNRLLNISPVIEDKRKAIREHASQLNELDYLEATISLNRYRAAMHKKETQYAEAFIYCTSTQYFELMKSVE